MTDAPEYADPARYAELTGFVGEWRDLFWNRDFLELMARRWRLHEAREVLDVGCGAGHWGRTVLRLLPEHATVVGVDREPAFLEMAREQAEAHGLAARMSFCEGTVEALPFDDDRFDVVTCQLVLIHVADVEVALREMIRVTRPGGLVVVAEPDNRAGNLALLNGHPALEDDEIAALVLLMIVCERGKQQLHEGNQSVGGLLPGLFRAAGLHDVRAHANDRCIDLAPPYQEPAMRVALEQELAWAREGISNLIGTRADSRRLFLAGGGTEAAFESAWGVMERWMQLFTEGVDQGTYHAARGFLFYLCSGRKPG
ncbi:class I SAM-dependent methyltransferase [Paraliomyxa miuraensis]|uniref:class I SAM-dependent methyltransferase n=1 Tax=Paraliomyxa miuraensis TaxID=376150 RepID=UPI00225A6E5F|nr:class I SAM-dependent methyltransferase [Paraliomyxa miuraensis]MCX4240223.1 class I SAM-dependent methyltransferase [Paraliomyxa miuraensis]